MPMTRLCSSGSPLSNSQLAATLSRYSDRAYLAFKEALISGKSESRSSSRDSESTCINHRACLAFKEALISGKSASRSSTRDSESTRITLRGGERPEVEGSGLELARMVLLVTVRVR